MMNDDLFCDAQYGFVPGRSCMTQLLVTLERWTELLGDGDPMDVIYLDFRKAFDTVPHSRLIKKLEEYGIKGGLLTWIDNFLSDRRHPPCNGEWQVIYLGRNPQRHTTRQHIWVNSFRHFY